MDAPRPLVRIGNTRRGIEAKQAMVFLRCMDHASARDVVRPAAGIAHHLRVRQESLAPPQGLFGALEILDVRCRSVPSNDASCFVAQWRAVDQAPAIFTIGSSSQTRFILERLPGR